MGLRRFILLFTISAVQQSVGQMMNSNNQPPELMSLEYALFPSIGEHQVDSYRVQLNGGIPLGRGVLGTRISYKLYKFRFSNEDNPGIDYSPFEEMNELRFQLFYSIPINKSWSVQLVAAPVLASNFKNNLSTNDLIYSGFASITKRWVKQSKNSNLTLGIGYGTMFGRPQVIPMLSFSSKVSDRVGYRLGLPVSGLDFQINERNRLSLLARPQGYFGNNSERFAFGFETYSNTKLQFTSIQTGIEYKYRIQPNWTISFSGGFLPWVDLKIVDEDANDLYEFNTDSSIYITTSLKYNLNRQKDEKKQRKRQ